MTNANYFMYMNKNVDKFPLIHGRKLEDVIDEKMEKTFSNQRNFSVLRFHKGIGIYEEIYGAKVLKGKVHIQKLMIIPENTHFEALGRNFYYCNCGMSAGFHSYGYNGRGCTYYSYSRSFWYADKFDYTKINRTELFDSTDIAQLDETLKYNAYEKNSYYVYAIDYIRLFRKYPQVCETLMKVGIFRMFTEKALKTLSENKELLKFICKNHNDCQYMAFQTAFNSFKKNKNGSPMDYQKSLLFRIKSGKEASFSERSMYEKVLKYTTQEKLAKYLKDNSINKESYADYIKACDWLKLDFNDTKVLFPHNFFEIHNQYTRQYYMYTVQDDKVKDLDERQKLIAKMVRTAERFSFLAYKTDQYCVFVAQSKADLIAEGSALQHCVGKMDYDKRQADGKSVICFIRKTEDTSTPFVTAEIKISGKRLTVNQCYGFKDKIVPEVQPFVVEWLKESNKAFKKVA